MMLQHLESCIWLATDNPERQEHDGREWICDPACPFNEFNNEVIKQMGEGQKKSEQAPNNSRH